MRIVCDDPAAERAADLDKQLAGRLVAAVRRGDLNADAVSAALGLDPPLPARNVAHFCGGRPVEVTVAAGETWTAPCPWCGRKTGRQ